MLALGLVETKGLVAAIEAADAMVKAASVKFVGREITVPAMITVKVIGDTAAVKAAVDAGAAAAQRVGQLISTHIIPQPDSQLTILLPEIADDSENKTKIEKKKSEVVKEKEIQKSVAKPVKTPKPEPKKKETVEIIVEEPAKETVSETTNETLERLRKEALDAVEDTEPEKEVTTKEKESVEDIDKLNVHELRHLARSIPEFPIKGREISRANKNELLKYFGEIQK
jgi:microcompartment protein CcmL/EutN